jgi:phenylacetate-CoA ligase
MIFQYSEADFLIEQSQANELVITVCRPHYIAPKVRYNIHHKGHVMRFAQVKVMLVKYGYSTTDIGVVHSDLPLLFHCGRSDLTVSFFGANISATDVQETLYEFPDLAAHVSTFYISADEDEKCTKQLCIHLERSQAMPLPSMDTLPMNRAFFEKLAVINQDFREALRICAGKSTCLLQMHERGTGPFVNNDIRIKARYTPLLL